MSSVKILRPDVEEKYMIDCERCFQIICFNGGKILQRPSNPTAPRCNWPMLYKRAVKHPEEFEIVYDAGITHAGATGHRYTMEELESMSMPMLRAIGKEFGVTSNSKKELCKNIVHEQDKEIVKK